MTEEKQLLPKWILIVTSIFALMELVAGLAICFAPQSMLENIDITAKGVDYLFYMWGSRQFALGFIFAYAIFKRSVPMLSIAYIFFLVMFIGDLLIGLVQKEISMIVSALVMCVISSLMLFTLNKKLRAK